MIGTFLPIRYVLHFGIVLHIEPILHVLPL